MTQPDSNSPLQHIRTADAFYRGMAQVSYDTKSNYLAVVFAEFQKRKSREKAEQAFKFLIPITKHSRNQPGTVAIHHISRFSLEYFSCLAALNLYRAEAELELFQYKLLSEAFLMNVSTDEPEWLGLYDATTPDFYGETGYQMGSWRVHIIRHYLKALTTKSSLDSDILIATRTLFSRNGVAKEAGLDATPALIEACCPMLEPHAQWLVNYVKYNA